MALALVVSPPNDDPESSPPSQIEWIAPPTCPDPTTAAQELRTALSAAPARVPAITATVTHDPPDFLLDYAFVLDDQTHRGQLRAPACTSLLDGLAAILAVAVAEGPAPAIDVPEATEPPAPVAATTTPTTTPTTTTTDPRPTEAPPPPAPPRRRPIHALLTLAGGTARGIVPAWSGLLTSSVGLRQRHWSAVLETNIELPRTVQAPGPFDARARLWVATVGPRVCGILGRGRVEGELCAGAQLGAVRGRGMGRDVIAREGASLVVTAVPATAVRVRVSPRVAVLLGADLLVPLARAYFGFDGVGDVCCNALGVRLRSGVEVQLP